jgi:hypothetical protein
MIYLQISNQLIFIYSPLQLRIINDQLMQLERAFQNPLGNGAQQADLK